MLFFAASGKAEKLGALADPYAWRVEKILRRGVIRLGILCIRYLVNRNMPGLFRAASSYASL
jgi:hypothetical protein